MFPSFRFASFIALHILCILFAGCATTTTGKKPSLTLSDATLTQIDFGGTDLHFDLLATNPTDQDLRLDAYRWELLIGNHRLAKGQSRGIQHVEPQTNLTIGIDISVTNGDVFNAVGTDRPTKPPQYLLRAGGMISSGLFNERADFDKTGILAILYKPIVTIQNFRVTKQTDTLAVVTFDASLENQNNFPVHLEPIVANLNLAGRPVAQEFKTSAKDIPANGKTIADFELELDMALLGRSVAQALRERDVNYEFSGATAFETPWGRKTLNFSQSGRLTINR